MWPFDRDPVLVLYVLTLALHAVFVGYVVAGTAYALVRRDAVADTIRDRLPFMLGCGITAGVAPLLFVQLLHQRRFYTANLLLGPRWMAIVPALIAGFYALYLAKKSDRWRRVALCGALACFVFVGWSWSELHELMAADAAWREFYAAGHRVFLAGAIAPRVVVAFAAMTTLFAMVAAWSADGPGRTRLALIAVVARIVAIGGALWLWRAGFAVDGPARAWLGVLGAAVVVELAAWIVAIRRPTDGALGVATAAGTGALLAAVVVREAPRIVLVEPSPGGSGGLAFALCAVLGAAAIAWIVRVTRVG